MNENEELEFDDLENEDDFNILDDSDDLDENELKSIKERLSKSNNQPKQIGRHSLDSDKIFNSFRKKRETEIDEFNHIIENISSIEIDEESLENDMDIDNLNYALKQEIKELLESHTDIDMSSKRKKPSKSDFNAYYQMLLNDLKDSGYTYTEIFIELAGYFTIDNWWNMLKLLDIKYSTLIIQELKEKTNMDEIDDFDYF